MSLGLGHNARVSGHHRGLQVRASHRSYRGHEGWRANTLETLPQSRVQHLTERLKGELQWQRAAVMDETLSKAS